MSKYASARERQRRHRARTRRGEAVQTVTRARLHPFSAPASIVDRIASRAKGVILARSKGSTHSRRLREGCISSGKLRSAIDDGRVFSTGCVEFRAMARFLGNGEPCSAKRSRRAGLFIPVLLDVGGASTEELLPRPRRAESPKRPFRRGWHLAHILFDNYEDGACASDLDDSETDAVRVKVARALVDIAKEVLSSAIWEDVTFEVRDDMGRVLLQADILPAGQPEPKHSLN